jgi:Ni/Co efflux regulator RcnB
MNRRSAAEHRLKRCGARLPPVQSYVFTISPSEADGRAVASATTTEETMMKLISRLLIAVALLTTGSFTLADQGDHGRHGHGHDRHDRGDYRHGRGHDDRRWRGDDHRRYGYRHGHRDDGPRYYGRRHWERGHRYYGPTYVVRNYGYYRLRPPPYGYHWVRADNDYLLVAIATGIILDVALR